MKPLVDDMVQEDPTKRPTIDEVLRRFDEIVRGLSAVKLRSRVVSRRDSSFKGFFITFPHWFRKISYIVRRIPAVPKVST